MFVCLVYPISDASDMYYLLFLVQGLLGVQVRILMTQEYRGNLKTAIECRSLISPRELEVT